MSVCPMAERCPGVGSPEAIRQRVNALAFTSQVHRLDQRSLTVLLHEENVNIDPSLESTGSLAMTSIAPKSERV